MWTQWGDGEVVLGAVSVWRELCCAVQVVWGVPEATDLASEVAIPLTHLRLPLSKHRWVTAATIISSPESLSPQTSSGISAANDDGSCCQQTESSFLVCGDRKGSLHVFQTSPSKEVYLTLLVLQCYTMPLTHSGWSHCSRCAVSTGSTE